MRQILLGLAVGLTLAATGMFVRDAVRRYDLTTAHGSEPTTVRPGSSQYSTAPNMDATTIRLRCVDNKGSSEFLVLDTQKETVKYMGDLFYNGKTERDTSGNTFHYAVTFGDEEIDFGKYIGKNFSYGGSLNRSSLIFHWYLGAGQFGDDGGIASALLIFGSATVPGMQCTMVQKRF